jgi:hypothetical protein
MRNKFSALRFTANGFWILSAVGSTLIESGSILKVMSFIFSLRFYVLYKLQIIWAAFSNAPSSSTPGCTFLSAAAELCTWQGTRVTSVSESRMQTNLSDCCMIPHTLGAIFVQQSFKLSAMNGTMYNLQYCLQADCSKLLYGLESSIGL